MLNKKAVEKFENFIKQRIPFTVHMEYMLLNVYKHSLVVISRVLVLVEYSNKLDPYL